MKAVGFEDVFETITGAPAKTFPSVRPLLPMDRIYVRGLKVHSVELLEEWYRLSDHLGIAAELELL
jgi:endonuclease/exonuclease/phosphatase family metal-dependent hydrolase